MRKKLLSLLVLSTISTVATPVAFAETELYGYLNGSADHMWGWARGSDVSDPTGAITAGITKNAATPERARNWNQIVTNSSYFGIRGSHPVNPDLSGLYQIESFVSLANTGSAPETINGSGSNLSLGSRNSFIGLGSKTWGAIKIGRNDTPYKTSTASMDPFANTVGDYNAIMGNTGGDNRVEFDYRAPHAIWYESPKWSGLQFNVLYSPGQQVSGNPADIANGEGILCTGGNNGGIVNGSQAGASGAGGFAPDVQPCSDGGFNSALSASLNYNLGPLLLTAAAERHNNVDRSGDFTIIPSNVTVPASGAGISVENETAYKIGASYKFGNVGNWGGNTVSGILERLSRTGPADERNRNGWFLSDVQSFGKTDLMLSWAHAGQSDNTNTANPGCYANGVCSAITNSLGGTGALNDKANLLAVGLRQNLSKNVNVYAVYAQDTNATAGHYGLGESGHGLPDTPNGTAGEKFKAFSVGGVVTF